LLALFEAFFGVVPPDPSNLEMPLEAKASFKKKKKRRRRKKKNQTDASGAHQEEDKGEEVAAVEEEQLLRKPTLSDILQNFICVLSVGLPLTYHEYNGRKRLVHVFISDEINMILSWRVGKGLDSETSSLNLKDVLYVESGLPLDDQCPYHLSDRGKEANSFVLVTSRGSHIFECMNTTERTAFVNGFGLLINHAQSLGYQHGS